MVQDDESTIKVHNDADACFFRIPLDYEDHFRLQAFLPSDCVIINYYVIITTTVVSNLDYSYINTVLVHSGFA